MKNLRNVIVLFFLLCLVEVTAADPAIGFDKGEYRGQVGDVLRVEIEIQNFPLTEGGGISLSFDPRVVKIVHVAVNEAVWSFAARDGITDNEKGVLKNLLFSSYAGVEGNALIGIIDVKLLKNGQTRLRLQESTLNPFSGGGERIPVLMNTSRIIVNNKSKNGTPGSKKSGGID